MLSSSRNERRKEENFYQLEYVWINIIAIILGHLTALYGLYLLYIVRECSLWTLLLNFVWTLMASLGITAGAHRLWAHKAYKANTPLRVFYAVLMSMIFANDIFTWARDHRAHHKYSETDADPHNSKRGFFFAHMGWLMVRKHPAVLRTQKTIDCSDLAADPVVVFHRKYYPILMPLGTFILPTVIPWLWGQRNSFVFAVLRYIINIHLVWSLNSVSHMFGTKPYDKNISPTFNTAMAYLTIGEGFHNYHHAFPWDYKAAEFGKDRRNLTAYFIDWCARKGWATDLKSTKAEMIKSRALRCGDGTWDGGLNVENISERDGNMENYSGSMFWGWDDPDLVLEK